MSEPTEREWLEGVDPTPPADDDKEAWNAAMDAHRAATAPPTDEGTTQRPGGWVEGIGHVALYGTLRPGDEDVAAWPVNPSVIGTEFDRLCVVTRWADGTVPAPPAASRTPLPQPTERELHEAWEALTETGLPWSILPQLIFAHHKAGGAFGYEDDEAPMPTDRHDHGACGDCDAGQHARCIPPRRQPFTVFRDPGYYLCNCPICWPPGTPGAASADGPSPMALGLSFHTCPTCGAPARPQDSCGCPPVVKS